MTIVNVRALTPGDPTVCYVGRGSRGWRPSPLGNPFGVGKAKAPFTARTRDEAIVAYRWYLWAALHDKTFALLPVDVYEPTRGEWVRKVAVPLRRVVIVAEFERMTEDTRLGCRCEPLPCHAAVIEKAWYFWRSKQ